MVEKVVDKETAEEAFNCPQQPEAQVEATEEIKKTKF